MAEVEVKISSMTHGSEQMRLSSQRLSLAVRTIQSHIEALMAMGFTSPAAEQFIAQYHVQRSIMDELPLTLLQFATRLEEALEDLQLALNGDIAISPITTTSTIPPSSPLIQVATPVIASTVVATNYYYGGGRQRNTKQEEVSVLQQHQLSDYVNHANRPLYDKWSNKNTELNSAQQLLNEYTQQHTTKTQELNALTNRILSVNPNADINQVVRVKSLREDIALLDQNIQDIQVHIESLKQDVSSLESRLNFVKPSAGADLQLIAQMEYAKTPDVVIQNTEDCVKYIVGKFAIPPNMATDAHLWNDNVTRLTEYGLSTGNTPLVGSVLVMEREHSYGHDMYGHVMYVERVDADGTVWITDNFNPDEAVRLVDVTQETSGANISYVYFPWHTKV